jgi:hypothetical protein
LETFFFLFHFMNCCIFCLFLDIIGIEHEHGFLWCVLAWKMAITLIIINQFVLVWICVLYVHMFCFHVFVLYIYIYIVCLYNLLWKFLILFLCFMFFLLVFA